MNKQAAPLSLFLGGFGLLFIIFAALEVTCQCLLPSLIFVLFHSVMVFAAFPFFIYAIYRDDSLTYRYYLIVALMTLINAVMMFSISFLDDTIPSMFYIASGLEFLPLPFILVKYALPGRIGRVSTPV